jgi:hypothetical protein
VTLLSNAPVDSRFYEVFRPNSLAERVLVAARNRIYADFLRIISPNPSARILDVGASDVVGAGANLLERLYPQRCSITAVGLGEGSDFRTAYPEVTYQRIVAGAPLPFADGEFDIVTSNAVVEHVGGHEAQKKFVAEIARVGRCAFITAPNRWFPVEHHTGLPFAHFFRPSFTIACKLTGKSSWLDEAELTLTGIADLRNVAPPGCQIECGYTGLPLGPFSSNIYLAIAAPF